MAVSKVILNGVTQMDVTGKTVTSASMLSGVTALKNDGTDVTGSIASKSSSDISVSDNTVTVPAGYYASSASVVVPSSGGSSMNVQAYIGQANTNQNTYTATDLTLTVAKTGTYTVSWSGWRNTTSGTSGSQLYRTRSGTETAIGSANTSFSLSNYGQRVELTGQSFQKDDVLTVYARARNTSYQMYVANLVIVQTA